jgi:hypothetical protein
MMIDTTHKKHSVDRFHGKTTKKLIIYLGHLCQLGQFS